MDSLRAMKDRVIVRPHYQSDRVGSIIIPDAYRDGQSQQGIVVASGVGDLREEDTVIYRPHSGVRLRVAGDNLLGLNQQDVVATHDGPTLLPRGKDVIVVPDFERFRQERAKGKGYKSLLITVEEYTEPDPVWFGKIEQIAWQVPEWWVEELNGNFNVILPPQGGTELGWIDQVYYIIPYDLILGVVP